MRLRLARLAAGLMLVAVSAAAPAQEAGPADAPRILAQVQAQAGGAGGAMPIVVLDQERLLSQSRYGQRIQREVEEAGAALSAENRRIEAQLVEEELALTEQRATMSAEEFRPLAEEFDIRVEGIRAAQEAKSRALQSQAEAAQARFFEEVFPILIGLLRERGASVLMDNRAVLLSAEGADITEAAVALVDAELGEGPEGPLIDLEGTGARPAPRPARPPADADSP
jgi:Skp family chaperone for outer membrane proteins